MPYIIRKKSRAGTWPYGGPTCEKVGVRPAQVYSKREDALRDAGRLSEMNPVGFDVVKVDITESSVQDADIQKQYDGLIRATRIYFEELCSDDPKLRENGEVCMYSGVDAFIVLAQLKRGVPVSEITCKSPRSEILLEDLGL